MIYLEALLEYLIRRRRALVNQREDIMREIMSLNNYINALENILHEAEQK